jgi:hypothetical protein
MKTIHINRFVFWYHMQIKIDYKLVVNNIYKSIYMAYWWINTPNNKMVVWKNQFIKKNYYLQLLEIEVHKISGCNTTTSKSKIPVNSKMVFNMWLDYSNMKIGYLTEYPKPKSKPKISYILMFIFIY